MAISEYPTIEARLIQQGFTHWKCDKCERTMEFFVDIAKGFQHAKGCQKPQTFHGVKVEG